MKELLEAIAQVFKSWDKAGMSHKEKQIAEMLVANGYGVWVEVGDDGDEVFETE